MTQSRKPKKTIRARARKTGESDTAALQKSEPRVVARTGHGFDHWFEVLDRFGADEKGHTASARHVAEAHGVDGWYAQLITVEYERARGLRATNQRMSGAYEVSVSKVLPAPVSEVVRALRDPKARTRWAATLDPKPNRKSSLVVQNMKLTAAADVDRYRASWKEAFAALERQLER